MSDIQKDVEQLIDEIEHFAGIEFEDPEQEKLEREIAKEEMDKLRDGIYALLRKAVGECCEQIGETHSCGAWMNACARDIRRHFAWLLEAE